MREGGLEPPRLAALDPKSVRPLLTIDPDRTKRNEIKHFFAVGSGVPNRSDALRCREWTQFGHNSATPGRPKNDWGRPVEIASCWPRLVCILCHRADLCGSPPVPCPRSSKLTRQIRKDQRGTVAFGRVHSMSRTASGRARSARYDSDAQRVHRPQNERSAAPAFAAVAQVED
jgi:hypothetical protein